MKSRTILIFIVIAIALTIIFSRKSTPATSMPQDDASAREVASFAWRFTQASTLNPDGNPQTNIFLDATHENGEKSSKLIEVSNGSCNERPDVKEGDMLEGTTIIQCYYAGQGFYYKIVKGEKAYQIFRKEFEEGSDEYIPPEQEYKPLTEFPL